jgi:hypothetical protein
MKPLSPHAINAVLLGIVIGAILGTVVWFLTEGVLVAAIAAVTPILLLLCFVRSIFVQGPRD